jgi:hypothetical protein
MRQCTYVQMYKSTRLIGGLAMARANPASSERDLPTPHHVILHPPDGGQRITHGAGITASAFFLTLRAESISTKRSR